MTLHKVRTGIDLSSLALWKWKRKQLNGKVKVKLIRLKVKPVRAIRQDVSRRKMEIIR